MTIKIKVRSQDQQAILVVSNIPPWFVRAILFLATALWVTKIALFHL